MTDQTLNRHMQTTSDKIRAMERRYRQAILDAVDDDHPAEADPDTYGDTIRDDR